jgi:hypothetical protein
VNSGPLEKDPSRPTGPSDVIGYLLHGTEGARSHRDRLALLTPLLTAFLILAAPAAASKTPVNSIGSNLSATSGGLFNAPHGIAVNQSGAGGVPAGTFYVVDTNNNRVQQFDPTARFVRTWGWGVSTETAQFEICADPASCKAGLAGPGPGQLNRPQGIAVDQANGNLYVTDQGNRRVDVFNPGGVFEGAFGWGVSTGAAAFQFCTTFTPCRSPNTTTPTGGQAGKFGSTIGYPAIDPMTGKIYVADVSNRRVDVFTPTLSGGIVSGITFTAGFGWDVSTAAGAEFEVCTGIDCKLGTGGAGAGQFGATKSPSEVALDSTGNAYVLDPGNNRVQKFDPTPSLLDSSFGAAALTAAFAGGALQDIAVDPSAEPNHLLLAGADSAEENRVRVAELDSTGASVDVHGVGLTPTASTGLGVAAESLGGNIYLSSSNGLFDHFLDILNAAPILDVVTLAGTTATFSGTVVSNGFDVTYHFEYSTDGTDWTAVPVPDEDAGSAPSTIPVSQEVKGLTGSQPYRVRLVANRPSGGGTAVSAEAGFATGAAAPEISATHASNPTDATATLNAVLNAQNEATTYHFEYVDDASFQAGGYSGASSIPVPEAQLGAGTGAVAIGREVGGLHASTVYHFRLVASNARGTTNGEDAVFTTYPPASSHLPDNRAYELVSLPDTNGFPATALGLGEGEANAFGTALAAPSGDSVIYLIAGSLPNTEGNGATDEYRAVRESDGWSSRLVSPSGAQSELPSAGGVSADHRYAFWSTAGRSATASDHGSLDLGSEEGSRYIRNPEGSFDLIGQGSLGSDPNAKGKWISPGATHIVFTSNLRLEPEAPESPGAGEDPTNFGLAAVDAVYDRTPTGTDVVSLLPGDAIPPPGSDSFYEGTSADGSAVVFLIDTTMYERRDDAETVEVASGSPKFAGVSQNGDTVVYLRPDGSISPERGEIFAFDADSETTTQIASAAATVINVSADGSHVYFSSTALIDGEGTEGVDNLYVWDGATTRLIAALDPADLSEFAGTSLLNLARWTDAVGPRQNPNVGPESDPSRTTPDGRVFVFESHASLTSYDSEGHSEIYRYDAAGHDLACISCSPIGAPPSSDAHLVVSGLVDERSPTGAQALIQNVTDDGEGVFFQTGDALVPRDTNGALDVYEWKLGSLALISSGHSPNPSYLYGMTPDGHDVFFRTREALVPADHTAAAGAIYDARVDGGFPAGAAAPSCVEDACQGPPSAPPSLPAAGSAAAQGEGNARLRPHHPRRRCGRGSRRVKRHGKVRCVKRRRGGVK